MGSSRLVYHLAGEVSNLQPLVVESAFELAGDNDRCDTANTTENDRLNDHHGSTK